MQRQEGRHDQRAGTIRADSAFEQRHGASPDHTRTDHSGTIDAGYGNRTFQLVRVSI